MNTKVIIIFICTIAALVVLWAYSFGPLANKRSLQANPASLQPIPERTVLAKKEADLNAYHNRDLKENYYTVKLPQLWQVGPASRPGGYTFTFAGGSGSVELTDVPDNSTLELFVLSQQEPALKKSVAGYNRVNYQKLSINGNDSYQLTYRSSVTTEDYETVRTYIAGQDQACVVTLTSKRRNPQSLQPVFMSIVNSFRWENK